MHSVAAVGVDPDDEDREKAIGALLSWLGGVEGQRPLAENRLGIPAHRDLRSAWEESWATAGVDVSVLEAPAEPARPEQGARSAEATGAALEVIAEVFRGESTAEEALPRPAGRARGDGLRLRGPGGLSAAAPRRPRRDVRPGSCPPA